MNVDSEVLGLMKNPILKWTGRIQEVDIILKTVELIVDPVYIFTEGNKYIDCGGIKVSKIKR